jgi:hypothetical protein
MRGRTGRLAVSLPVRPNWGALAVMDGRRERIAGERRRRLRGMVGSEDCLDLRSGIPAGTCLPE